MDLQHISHPRPKHNGSKTLFENPWLERLTRTHIAVPVSIFFAYSAALVVWCLWRTTLTGFQVVATFVAGLAVFTLVEYAIHRFVYHIRANTESRARFQYKFHGVHHEFPKDKDRLAMPPWLSAFIATGIVWGLHALMGDLGLAFFSGFIAGYAAYLLVHYSVHAFASPKNLFKALWVNHAVHHYRDQGMSFGVSSPVWDYVFGTFPPPLPNAKSTGQEVRQTAVAV